MSRRRLYGVKKQLVEFYEEITASRSWVVPAGCISVDAFVVGGGETGGVGDGYNAGKGGNGGECKTYYGIPVTPGQGVTVTVGNTGNDSYFLSMSYIARGADGRAGGNAIPDRGSSINGNPGQDGVIAFNNSSRFPKKYGASGGSGAWTGGSSGLGTYTGGAGGSYGAGKGGNSTWVMGTPTVGDAGDNATWYGAGGGGGGKSVYYSTQSRGGSGYQGIIILHYFKYA